MIDSTEILHLKEVDSTNEHLKKSYLDGRLEDGFTITASLQNKGKGQYNKTWESEKDKNLLFSMFIEAGKQESKEKVSFAAAIAVLQLVNKLISLGTVKIKWPNDILVDGEKIAGILIENRYRGQQLEASFIGVGLNVNQLKFPRFSRPACSLKSLSRREFNLKELADKLRRLMVCNLKKEKEVLIEDYNKFLYLKCTPAPFLYKGKQVNFTIIRVLGTGQLIIKNNDGTSQQVSMGELKFLN